MKIALEPVERRAENCLHMMLGKQSCSIGPCDIYEYYLGVQVVRSILWPTESAPVYLTAGEDGRICIWPVLGADVSGTGAKRGLDAGAPVEAKQHKKKRRKQDGRC